MEKYQERSIRLSWLFVRLPFPVAFPNTMPLHLSAVFLDLSLSCFPVAIGGSLFRRSDHGGDLSEDALPGALIQVLGPTVLIST